MNVQVTEGSRRAGLADALGSVERAMSTDIVVLASDTHIGEALVLMEFEHATRGVVVEAGRIVGIVTVPDLVGVRAVAASTGTLWGPGRGVGGWRVADVMTLCASEVTRTDPLERALVELDEAQLDGLPVLDEGGQPVGLLSRRDVIHALAERMRGSVS